MNESNCASCVFFISGECHRFPPIPHAHGLRVWPQMQDWEWCGEFKAKPLTPAQHAERARSILGDPL